MVKPGIVGATLAALCLSALPVSAQIISTSIPQAETSGPQSAEKKFAVHGMVAPISKWHYNELVAAPIGSSTEFYDVGLFSGTPNSDILLAGEAVVKLGRRFTVGGGGWYNKVGEGVPYTFSVKTYDVTSTSTTTVESVSGTLNGDLKLSEGHLNFFVKDYGVQWGAVHTTSKLTQSAITQSTGNEVKGTPLHSIEKNGADYKATDWDLYGVYKYAARSGRPFGISGGAGIYHKSGNVTASQGSPNDQNVFSGFLTGNVDLYKGIGLDLSYWYIAKTKADFGGGTQPVSAEKANNRLTIGFSYTFSK